QVSQEIYGETAISAHDKRGCRTYRLRTGPGAWMPRVVSAAPFRLQLELSADDAPHPLPGDLVVLRAVPIDEPACHWPQRRRATEKSGPRISQCRAATKGMNETTDEHG